MIDQKPNPTHQNVTILRPYQEQAAEFTVQYACDNIRGRLLVVMPPGGGKTPFMAYVLRTMAAEQGLRGVVWAHRRELVTQAYEHLVECGIPENMLGVVMSGDKRHNPSAPIQVASVNTLRGKAKPPADIIVSDEAHRDASDGRRKLRAMYPDAFHLGLTATPIRLDGRGLNTEYDRMYVAAIPSQLLAEGYISAPTVYTVPDELLPNLKGVHRQCGDFNESELEDRSNRRAIIGGIVDHWKRRAENRRTVVFAVGVRHSMAIAAAFVGAGIRAEHIDGGTSHGRRKDILKRLRSGDIQVVTSCGVLSEGLNIPEIKCVVQARATHSLSLCIQQSGRCMRPFGGIVPLVLDHCGNTHRHGLPHDDREWSLESNRRRGASGGVAPVKTCQSCNMIVPFALLSCPGCGTGFEHAPPEPIELDGELVEARNRLTVDEQRAGWQRIERFAKARNLPTDWAVKVYAVQFGMTALPPGA